MKNHAFFLLIALLVCSCAHIEDYPPEPTITYGGFYVELDTVVHCVSNGIISIGYRDGNGDLGLNEADTMHPFGPGDEYYYNLIITYFEIQNRDTVEVPLVSWNSESGSFDTVTFNARIPRLLDEGEEERSVEGVINYSMFIDNPLSSFDTILFKAYLIDRALNRSNEIVTDLIIRNYSHYIE